MMKSSLDHLPTSKQRELKKVEDILLEEFEDALSDAKAAWKKKGRVLKIILFGSYARGGWVDEANVGKGYRSDYDLLVVVHIYQGISANEAAVRIISARRATAHEQRDYEHNR